jgi:hypothetical protein
MMMPLPDRLHADSLSVRSRIHRHAPPTKIVITPDDLRMTPSALLPDGLRDQRHQPTIVPRPNDDNP